ncbi:MAG: IS66 family insertion sequence element accessory protein TnpB [Aliarcobacter butzleri]|nr:IS66 family insertion sequence element accessory protein TnpB [Aliarcobacter butzleri]
MIDLSEVREIYIYSNRVDMRIGMNKIELLLALSFSPIEILKSVFIFVSKNKKQIKIYYENEFGKWLLINKLSYTTFRLKDDMNKVLISKEDLSYLLKGVALKSERIKEITI